MGLALGAWLLLSAALLAGDPVVLMGSNGREVAFAGVLEAQPDGLKLKVQEDQSPILVPWERLDIIDLETRHPPIYQAVQEARQHRRTVPLRLGIYAQYQDYQQLVQALARDFNRPYTVPVPAYEDYLTAYQRLYFRSNSDYNNFARNRRRVFDNYAQFLEHFFPTQNIRLSVSRSSFSQNVYSAFPDKRSVPITGRQVLAFFGDERARSRREAVVYLHTYPQVLAPITESLRKARAQVPNPLLDRTNPDEIYLETLLDNCLADFEHLQSQTTFPHRAIRNFQLLARTLDQVQVNPEQATERRVRPDRGAAPGR